MDDSVLSSIGVEIIGVMSPVSICMLLVVLLVYSLSSSTSSSASFRSAATLVYLESPADSATHKLEGALLNALVFVILIALVTFLLVLLYYYNFTNFLKNYMRFSAFFVLATMGGSIFLSIIQHFSVPVDSITCFVLLFNFTVVGVLCVFSMSGGIPILLRQAYMVVLGIIVAAWFTKLPEWTTWVLLVALAVYDLVAVLAPGGPLKILVELASTRDEELPALVYEARPAPVSVSGGNNRGSTGPSPFVAAGMASDYGVSVELQNMESQNNNENPNQIVHIQDEDEIQNVVDDGEASPLVPNLLERHSHSGEFLSGPHSTSNHIRDRRESEIVVDDDEEMLGFMGGDRNPNNGSNREDDGLVESSQRGIKLGLGDFVFYSVLVGRAALYDLMTVYACYVAIISGLGCTLILLAVCRQALPALPISIALGIMFYFLTRLLMEPFIVGTATNLMMF